MAYLGFQKGGQSVPLPSPPSILLEVGLLKSRCGVLGRGGSKRGHGKQWRRQKFFSRGLSPFPLSLSPPSPSLPDPFPSPSLPPLLPSPPFPSPPLRSRPPLLRLGGLGERFSSLSGSRRSPAAKRILVHFELKSRHMVATIFRTFLRIN